SVSPWLRGKVFFVVKPELSVIRAAQTLLASRFSPTRLLPAPALSRPDAAAYLKLEIDLPTGSFKPRGAFFALATNLQRRQITEVVAASTGNHGAAVAWAARELGVAATIFLPQNPNQVKRRRISELGARIVEAGGTDLADASHLAKDYAARDGVYFLDDATEPDLPAGPATIGLEILEQLPSVAAVYVPMGDTALIRGIGAAIKQAKPGVRIIGVQAAQAPSYYLSWKAGRPVPTETCDTIADGLATRTPNPENVSIIRELVDDVFLVTEEEMIEAIRLLYQRCDVVAEPAGAATTASFLKTAQVSGPTVLIVSGSNISDDVRQRAGLLVR